MGIPCKQTDMSENITFLQLRWRAVTRHDDNLSRIDTFAIQSILTGKFFESKIFQKKKEPSFYYFAYLLKVLTKIVTLTNYDEFWFLFNEEILGFFLFFRFRFIFFPPLLVAPSGAAVAADADISCSSSELSRASPIPSSSLSSSSKPDENKPLPYQ